MGLYDGQRSHDGDYGDLAHRDLWSTGKMDGSTTRIFLDLTKKYWEQVSRRLMSATRKKNHDPSSSFQTWANSQIHTSLTKGEVSFPFGGTLQYHRKYMQLCSPILLQNGSYSHFSEHWTQESEEDPTFLRAAIESELFISRKPQMPTWLFY